MELLEAGSRKESLELWTGTSGMDSAGESGNMKRRSGAKVCTVRALTDDSFGWRYPMCQKMTFASKFDRTMMARMCKYGAKRAV